MYCISYFARIARNFINLARVPMRALTVSQGRSVLQRNIVNLFSTRVCLPLLLCIACCVYC